MNWLSNASVDELGNSLIRSYMGDLADKRLFVDIDGFVTEYLKLTIVFERFAEKDMTKLGFISDGKTPLNVFDSRKQRQIIFPKGTIVIDKYLCAVKETGRRRFTIAHEAAHFAESLTMRNIRCPYCGFLVEKVFSDIRGHKQVFCKKCKEKYIVNLGYFRRQRKLKYFKIHFPDKTRRER